MDNNLSEILYKAQQGSESAQIKFYEACYLPIFNSCLRVLFNKEDAEDITHDTFIHVFNKKILIPEKENIVAWMRRIGINKSIDFLRRKNKIQVTDNIQDLHIKGNEESYKEEFTVDPKAIIEAIKQLPQQYRIILSLYLIEGYDHSEISEILKINNSSSRSHYTRAKSKLKSILEQERSA